MRPKLYGIGKCGSRVVFDFSAYTYGHPPAFELRNSNLQTVDQIVGFYKSVRRAVKEFSEAVLGPKITPVRLYTTYSSVAIDSDLDGNEVIKLQASITEERHAVRPIQESLQLGRREGGCEFGMVSEAFTSAWLSASAKEAPVGLDPDVTSEKFALVATSLGGGTGSGASTVLAQWIASRANKKHRPFHVSIVGVLPMSDLDYGGNLLPVWDFADRVNAGRSLAVFLSQAAAQPKAQVSPGLWVVSNDLLRICEGTVPAETQQVVNDHSVSVVNYHVATVACFLSNIAGAPEDSPDNRTRQYVMVEANFDSAEMNNHLGGNLYFTGYSSEDTTNDLFQEDRRGTLFARSLLRRALDPLDLGYTFGKDSALHGCGVPFRRDEWDSAELDAWCQGEGFQRPEHLPVELRTAGWVGVLYGQPEDHRSAVRSNALKQALWELFPAADIQIYPFSHRFNSREHLCLFVAGGFSRVAYMALVGYCEACLGAGDSFLPDLDAVFRNGDATAIDSLVGTLCEVETYNRNRFGVEADELARSAAWTPAETSGRSGALGDYRPTPRLLTRDRIALALRYLYDSYRRPPKLRRATSL